MRIFCLSRIIKNPEYVEKDDEISYKDEFEFSSNSINYKKSKTKLLNTTLMNAADFGLSEIQIGKIYSQFYFVLYWKNVEIIKIPLTKNAIKIIKKEKLGDNYAIDLELQTKLSFSPFVQAQNPIKFVQIRVIKNTANTDITIKEIKLYNEYAKTINDIAKSDPDLFPEAFKQEKLKLSNLCKPKSLGTKVNDFCNAINNCCKEAPDIPFSEFFTKDFEAKNAEEKRKRIRYNQILDEDVEILCMFKVENCIDLFNILSDDFGKPYDPRRELSRDYSKCQKLSYDSVIISTINERWFLATSMISLKFNNIDVFLIPKMWEMFEKNIGKLEHLFILEINRCKIKELPESVIKNLPKSIGSLILSGNFLTFLSNEIAKLENLQNLDLSENRNLTDNGIPWNHIPISLEAMDLRKTKVTQIPDNTKHRLINLTNLLIYPKKEANSIGELVDLMNGFSLTKPNKNLHEIKKYSEKFILRNSKLKDIKEIQISSTSAVIDLSFNELQIFNLSQTFNILYSLNLSHNKLRSINYEILPVTLEVLDLSHNYLTDIGDVGHLKRLHTFLLNNNHLLALPKNITNLTNFTVFNISNNYISELPQNFENLNIGEFDISNNKFNAENGNLKQVFWQRLSECEILTLNGNAINELSCELSRIPFKKLFAVKCNLQYICPQIYKKLNNERFFELDVSGNPSLTNLSFIPKRFYQPIMLPEERNIVQKLNETLKPDYFNGKGRNEWTTIITDTFIFKKNRKTINRADKRPTYNFQDINETDKITCKCCAWCEYISSKDYEYQNTSMVEQTMVMDFRIYINKNDVDVTITQPSEWQSNIKTRLCLECKHELIENSNAIFEARKNEILGKNPNKKEPKKLGRKPNRKNEINDDEIVLETEKYNEKDEPNRRGKGNAKSENQIQAPQIIYKDESGFSNVTNKLPSLWTLFSKDKMQQENSSHIIYDTPFQPSLPNLEENANMNFSNVAFGYSYSNPQVEKIVLIDKNEKEIAQWKLVNPFLITDSPIYEEKKENITAADLTVEDYKMIDLSLDITEQNSNFDDCEIIFENLQPRIKSKDNNEIMFETCYIHGSNNQQIEARIYDLIMPSSDDLELYIPPPFNYLERYLELLGMQSNLVANSPLLQNSSIELKDKKIITMKTKADGNCGYRAISILLTGVEDYYWDIRIKIYEYIISEGENIWGIKSHEKINEFKQKLEKILKMSQKAVSKKFWCGNEDLYALANLFECNIYTFSPNPLPNYPHITPHYKNNVKIPEAPTLFLLWINNNHFEPIIGFN